MYLVIHGFEIDNYVLSEDVRINNQTGTSTVKAGSSFTLDITVSAQGDPLINYNPIPVTISHVSSIAFVGAIFGPAVVGISAETFGLTFNMYALGVIMFLIALLMFFIMREDKLVGVEGIEPTPPK